MALDQRLSLMVDTPDVSKFFQGIHQGQNLMNMPLQNELLQQKVTQGQEQIGLAPMRREALQQQLDQGQNTLATQRNTLESEKLKKQIFGAQKLVAAFGRNDHNGGINAIKESFSDPAEQQAEIAEYEQDRKSYVLDAQAGIDAFNAQRTGVKTGLASAVTKVFDNGTTVQSLPDGTTQVINPEGKVVSGKDRVSVLNTARNEQVDFAGQKAKSTALGTGQGKLQTEPTVAAATDAAKAAIKLSTETFNRLEPLRANIANIDEAIELIDAGAATGPIISRLPSVRATSIKLDALQKKLGLDVIASTTFGALSEGEREFALSSALPKNLQGNDLKSWLQKKKETQTKLMDQLGEAASFLGTPGNTIADYIELTKIHDLDRQKASPESIDPVSPIKEVVSPPEKTGGRIMIDANGNRARVFDDGSFEEIK